MRGRALRPGRPRVLLIAPPNSYRIPAYVEAAKALGCDLLIASSGRHSLVAEVADGLHLDLRDRASALERVLAEARRRPFAAVVATDDATVELASHVSAALGLPHNPPSAARTARRKDLARAALAAAGLPVPEHRCLDLERDLPGQLAGLPYPCVVKPLSLSASRGVIRTDSPAELLDACARVSRILAGLEPGPGDDEERRCVLVERFLPGTEVAVEGLLHCGDLTPLAVFDKPDPLDGPYFEETYYITPSRLAPEVLERIVDRVARACAAYGLREGPVHAELRVAGADAWILEVAARTIGGECARLLRFGTGFALEELVLAQALGRPAAARRQSEAAGVLMIPVPGRGVLRRIEGVLEARRVPWVEDVSIAIREGYELVPLPEGASYLGFIFARGPTPEAVEEALRRAHACLRIVVAPVWRLQPA